MGNVCRAHIYTFVTVLCLIVLTTYPIQASAKVEHTPQQTLTLLGTMNNCLEAIRIYMGKPRQEIPKLDIEDAKAHETYYQAVNLYDKANRLALEITRTTHELPPFSNGGTSNLDDIHSIIQIAMQRITKVAAELDINAKPVTEAAAADSDISDVYEAILNTSQQINQLLETPFSPSDVYQQVTMALHITQDLYARLPGERRVIPPPKWIPGKRPDDVYQLLLGCYEIVRDIAKHSRIKVLKLSVTPKQTPYQPGEVYDIATLLRSELEYIHTSIPGLPQPAKSYYPGRKYPSDVYQRARQLQQTLVKLDELVKQQVGQVL